MSSIQKSDHPKLIQFLLDRVDAADTRRALLAKNGSETHQWWNWVELGAAVEQVSRWIESRLNLKGQSERHVGYISDNSSTNVVVALACMNLGAIEFPFDHRLSSQEIHRRWSGIGGLWIDLAEIESYLSEQKDPVILRDRSEHLDPDAISLVLWTSGTTGTPKGVALSHRNLAGNAASKLKAAPQLPEDRRLCVLPLCHGYARTCDLGGWLISGCSLAVSLGYRGIEYFAPVVEPTLMNLVPSLAARLLKDTKTNGLDKLRMLGCGGAGLSEADFHLWTNDRNVTVIQGYGLTETSPVICSATPDRASAGLVGDFVEGWEHKVVSEQLFVRGPHVMKGYWNDPKSTRAKVDGEGWLATGDQVEVDQKTRQIRILGRVDDVIVLSNAVKVYPESIERQVNSIRGVRHSMLINRDNLELWLDATFDFASQEEHKQAIHNHAKEILRRSIPSNDCEVHFFSKPLQDHELTSKGTIRRVQIRKDRF